MAYSSDEMSRSIGKMAKTKEEKSADKVPHKKEIHKKKAGVKMPPGAERIVSRDAMGPDEP